MDQSGHQVDDSIDSMAGNSDVEMHEIGKNNEVDAEVQTDAEVKHSTNADNSKVKPIKPEQALQYDPFLRTRDVPFRVARCRLSISVFNQLTPMKVIHEDAESPEN